MLASCGDGEHVDAVDEAVPADSAPAPPESIQAPAAVTRGLGRLDHEVQARYGEFSLRAGFSPDPRHVEVVAGGRADASYLGAGCTGFADAGPDFSIAWTGGGTGWGVRFVDPAHDPSADAKLIVRRPDGSWACDDNSGHRLDPSLWIDAPTDGRYHIWVGSREEEYPKGLLLFTQRAGPWLGGNVLGTLDHGAAPSHGEIALDPRFRPHPYRTDVTEVDAVIGPPDGVDVSYLGPRCVGYAAVRPTYRLHWGGGGGPGFGVRFDATTTLTADPTLIVRLPDGSWACDDDSGHGIDPYLRVEAPTEGRHDIWVGRHNLQADLKGALSITDLNVADHLDYSATPRHDQGALSPGFRPDPYQIEIVTDTYLDLDVSHLAPECVGFAAGDPDYRVLWSGGTRFNIRFQSGVRAADPSLVVRLPDGTWMCDDDSGEGGDPSLWIGSPVDGRYDIWVANSTGGLGADGVLLITEREHGRGQLGRLDHDEAPISGAVTLGPGFRSNPHRARVVAGGPMNVDYLGPGCTGFASIRPDYRIEWSGSGTGFGIGFETGDTLPDPTLILRLPDGTWSCDDDLVEGRDPFVWMDTPADGRYDIWVGSHHGRGPEGFLVVTETDPRTQ